MKEQRAAASCTEPGCSLVSSRIEHAPGTVGAGATVQLKAPLGGSIVRPFSITCSRYSPAASGL